MIRQSLSLIAAILILATSACGGGGGTSGSTPTTYDLDAFAGAYAQAKHSYTLSATNAGNTYTAQLSQVPGPSAACGSTTAHTTTVTTNLLQNGTLVANDSYTRYYLTSPYQILCDYDGTTGYVTLYQNQVALPSAASIGDSGTSDTATTYYDTSLTTVFGTMTDTWTLNSGSGGDAVFCADSVSNNATGKVTESDCYTLNSNGKVLGLTVKLDLNGLVLTFQ